MSTALVCCRLAGLTQRLSCMTLSRTYAAKATAGAKAKKGKGAKGAAAIVERVKIPAETNTKKLVKYVCGSNIYIDGKDIEIKPESEYPEWLFQLNVDKPPTLDELEPNTKVYWRRLRKEAIKRNNRLAKLKRF